MSPDPAGLRGRSLKSLDGLERVDVPLDGVLELREHNQVNSYDELLIPHPALTHKRDSLRLTTPGRRISLALLRESLVEAIDATDIPIVEEPAPCVIEIQLAAIGMNVDYSDDAVALATMTTEMQLRDSRSREPLLGYSTKRLIASPEEGVTQSRELRRGLSETVESLNLASALRDAGLADDVIRSGCKGTFANLGRAAQRALRDQGNQVAPLRTTMSSRPL